MRWRKRLVQGGLRRDNGLQSPLSATMSLPGLNVATPVPEAVTTSILELKENTEWRFEVAFGTTVAVKVDHSFRSMLFS